MQESEVYAYQWHSDDSENKTVIHMFGIDSDNKNVYVRIEGFTPYIYLEIPEDIDWKLDYNVKNLYDKIDEVCSKYGSRNKPISRQLKYKKKLYYANKIQEGKNLIDKKFPFVCLVFNTKKSISFVRKELDKGFHMSIIRDSKKILQRVNVKVHESNATPVLQLTCFQKLSPTGWLRVKGHRVVKSGDKESYCDVEYISKWTDIKPIKTSKENIPHPLIMSFDIEVNSKNVNAMPSASIPEDKVFQISCLFLRQSDDINKNCEKYLLTLGNPDPKKVGEDVIIRKYPTESCLLEGYSELICEKNPNVIIGYNIFQFDIPYLIDRSQFNFCQRKFNQQSFLIGKEGTCRKISWSSSAYKNQDFTFLDSEGRLFIDLLPIVKRDYIFDTYSLKNVSANFLGQTKDPLTPKGIFKCYRMFTPQSLGVVGKYVVQDSMLVLRLFEKLQVWIGLTEMSKICNTPMLSLFTQGQQVKIFSQIYKICIDSNYVVEQDGYICGDGDNYTGAYVFDPVPGLYDMVVSFDFSSLYPSIIIAYNIDYTTLVRDPSIPDELCHTFEWEDHIGCKHETKKRKTKPKNIVCGSHKFRFLKEPKGIMPALLENLLKSRKDINSDIKTLKLQLSEEKEENVKSELQTKITVLDKRQLAMKISANSMYGGFGVKKGYLPFMPGAMCTTAKGRESIEKAAKHLQQNYSANLIYGDTDSCYINFPLFSRLEDSKECYDFCVNVENEMLSLFPRPMKLTYEEKIYWRFFILSKKRYMALQCKSDGKIADNIFKRGVVLNRRDNSKLLKNLYSDIIMKVFYKEGRNLILNYINDKLTNIFQFGYKSEDYVTTKSIGKVEDYKIRQLSEDDVKKNKRLEMLNCTEKEYYSMRGLPSHIQLAERMKNRGKRVEPGTRLEHIIIDNFDLDGKLFDKIESWEYFRENSDILRIDFYYYLKSFINPLDQVIETAFGLKDFIKKIYKNHALKYKMLQQLKSKSGSKINFIK
jgi:DNA polymerase elongation subunit (family B)